MVDELKRKLAVMEAERGMLAVSDARYVTLFSADRIVTARFGDILPIATLVADGLAGASDTSNVMYIDSRPPGIRVEQLASFIETFMNRGPSITGWMAPLVREETLFFVPVVNCEWPTENHASDCLNRFDGTLDGYGYCVKAAHLSAAGGAHFAGRVIL
jgi:hypothetical protein